FALLSAFSPAMTSPSRVTRRTERNSTAAPFSPGTFSMETSWPGATRYCLPPVAITASMSDLSSCLGFGEPPSEHRPTPCVNNPSARTAFHRRASAGWPPAPRRPAARPALGRRGPGALRRLHVLGELLAHEEARAMHARLHGRQTDAERLGDVRVRQTLDVVHDQRRAVVGRQLVDGGAEHPAQLALERLLVDPLPPVGHRLPAPARGAGRAPLSAQPAIGSKWRPASSNAGSTSSIAISCALALRARSFW